MRFSAFVLLVVVAPCIWAADDDVNISKCSGSLKREFRLSKDIVAVVRTNDGPSAAILLSSASSSEVSYVWRYRERENGPVTIDNASVRPEEIRTRKTSIPVAMDVGRFVIEWNVDSTSLTSLYYCLNLALVQYYTRSEFKDLP
jgi:hypothetical protein